MEHTGDPEKHRVHVMKCLLMSQRCGNIRYKMGLASKRMKSLQLRVAGQEERSWVIHSVELGCLCAGDSAH